MVNMFRFCFSFEWGVAANHAVKNSIPIQHLREATLITYICEKCDIL